jgi:hypothetical protein
MHVDFGNKYLFYRQEAVAEQTVRDLKTLWYPTKA